jgi:hypothetical protein
MILDRPTGIIGTRPPPVMAQRALAASRNKSCLVAYRYAVRNVTLSAAVLEPPIATLPSTANGFKSEGAAAEKLADISSTLSWFSRFAASTCGAGTSLS